MYAPPDPLPDLSLPKEGLNVATDSSPDLPHWTEPPTGEVPRVLGGGDDDEAWSGAASRGPRWRDSHDNWDDELDMAALVDDEVRVGALDESRSERSDIYDFDEPLPSGPTPVVADDEIEPEPEPSPAAVRTRTRARQRPPKPEGDDDRTDTQPDLPVRILTGVAILIVALIAFSRGTGGTAVLATVIVTACAFEAFTVLRRAGYLPAIPIGLLATVSIMGGAYWKGERAIPLVFALTLITTMLWYLLGVVRARPTINIMVTMGAFAWVGGLGAFASLMLVAVPNHHGVGLLIGAVLATVACDIGGFIAGRAIGRTPLMPEVSPHKTWEGAIGGLTGSLVASVAIVARIHPWNDIRHALLLGLVVAVVSPLGDLCESMIKRDLSLKDMGAILPGHGGVLDRFDSMLFVLPAAYYLALYLNIR
jgi:phosphatidate cytidylyltransferase